MTINQRTIIDVKVQMMNRVHGKNENEVAVAAVNKILSQIKNSAEQVYPVVMRNDMERIDCGNYTISVNCRDALQAIGVRSMLEHVLETHTNPHYEVYLDE